MSGSLSKRGEEAAKSVLRIDMEAYFEAKQNLYDPFHNPTGAFPLNVAENRLSWSIIKKKVEEICRSKEIPEWVSGYTSGLGAPTFREAVSNFLTKFLTGCKIDPDRMVFSAGATGVVEMTSLVLGDEGDVVAFPSPCYPVYKQDIGNIGKLERFDIITHHEISEIQHGPVLKVSHLEEAKKEIEGQNKGFKMLVLTNPDNPTGGIYSEEKLEMITDWCIQNEIHLVVNEIYGLTLLDTSHPELKMDYDSELAFKSFANIMEERQSPYLHLWYSFSKDFCISGFRVGLVYSLNEEFISAYENINYSHLVSNHTQWILQEMLQDEEFVEYYISTNRQLLSEAYIVVVKALREISVPYVPSRGSLFVWIDFSDYLVSDSKESEQKFWFDLFEKTGLLLTPGEGFGHTKRGLFRMVYPYFQKEDLEVAMDRMKKFLKNEGLNLKA